MEKAIEAIGARIVKGEVTAARRELRQLLQKKIPLALRTQVAGLARRVDMPLVGIKLLNPVVRPANTARVQAPLAAIAEYSGCLTFIGASAEAVELLRNVPAAECPESLLYRSFAHFAQWEYAQAIPLLKSYVQSPKLSEYARAIGKVNLLAALVHEKQHEEALHLRESLIEECTKHNYQRLLGNCFELGTAIYVEQRDEQAARATIAEAKKLAQENIALDIFYARKWEVVLNFLLAPRKEKSLSALHGIRAEAQNRSLWETVRQCDAYEAVQLKNEKLCAQVYFGTPYPSFRQSLLQDFGLATAPSELWYVLKRGENPGSLSLATGDYRRNAKSYRLKPGQICHRLLNILFSDLYRPLRVAVAHHELFPTEFFNPSSSAHRVHESVRRLREDLRRGKVPLTISEKEGFYRVVASQPLQLHFSQQSGNSVTAESAELSLLQSAWPETPFSVQECLKVLNVSKRTAIRTLNRLVEAGQVARIGESSATKYRILPSPRPKAKAA